VVAAKSARDEAADEAAVEQLRSAWGDEGGGGGADEVGDFFKTVAAVSRAEEQLVGEHRAAVEEDEQLLLQEKMMIEDLEQPDGCSTDEYAAQLERVIQTKIARYTELQKRLTNLKEFLANEEALGARVNNMY